MPIESVQFGEVTRRETARCGLDSRLLLAPAPDDDPAPPFSVPAAADPSVNTVTSAGGSWLSASSAARLLSSDGASLGTARASPVWMCTLGGVVSHGSMLVVTRNGSLGRAPRPAATLASRPTLSRA